MDTHNDLFIEAYRLRLRDAIYGLAVGDALGVPVESQNRGEYHIEGMKDGGFHDQPAGTWSDDTSLTLATCASIKDKQTINTRDILKQFRGWLYESRFTANGLTFGNGITTTEAIETGKGQASEMNNGNGSLVRIIPLAFLKVSDADIESVSAITHAHNIAKRACVIYVRFAQELLEGTEPSEALAKLDHERPFHRLSRIAQYDEFDIDSSGYVVDTLEAAFWCLCTTDTYPGCVLKAVNLGGDTDTIAAVSGALAGITYGYDAIPRAWIDALRGKTVIEASLFSS